MALLAIAQTMDHEKIHKLTDAFVALDLKNDGTIRWSELKSVLKKQNFIHDDAETMSIKIYFEPLTRVSR